MALFEFSIDIETAAGVKVGSGPITSATNWTHTPRLDGAGEFRFTMPASDEKARNLTNKRIVRCYGIVNGERTELGAGIIDTIQTQVGDPTMLEVSGPDIMGELAGPSVHELIVCEQAWTDLSDSDKGLLAWVRVSETGVADPTIAIPNAHDGDDGTYETIYLMSEKVGYPEHAAWLYVGYDARFDQIRVLFQAGDYADATKTLQAQYYNGSGWASLSVTDGTISGGGTFRQNGDITFTRPADWARYYAVEAGGDWFWVRLRVARTWPDNPSSTGYFKLAEVDVYADMPTTNGVNLIMAYAPDTWKQSGYAATKTKKYLEFQGESVLEALVTLAEQGGTEGSAAVREHFRYSTTPREIDWMGTTVTASGVRAIAPEDAISTEGVDELVVIQSLQRLIDTAEVVTRVYPKSADGMGIGPATDSAPTGYTTGSVAQGIKVHYYVEHDAGVVAYGAIEQHIEFSELSLQQADSYTTHPVDLANQLLERAVEHLRTHATANQFYQLGVAQFPALLRAGDTIECVYHEYVDGIHTVNIDTVASGSPLFILAPTLIVDSRGVGTIGLEVATIDREAKSDAGVVVDLVRERRRYGAGAGNYATIAVTGGGSPPVAGVDIRVSGYQVSRAGSGVLLFSGGGALLAEYATIATALAAATSGDIVEIPAGTLTENVTIPAGVTLRGMGAATVIDGAVRLGEGARLIDATASLADTDSDDLVVVTGGNSAVCVHVTVIGEQSGAGAIIGIVSTADSADTPMRCYDCQIDVENSGGGSAWWTGEVVAGGLQMHQGSVWAEIAEDE